MHAHAAVDARGLTKSFRQSVAVDGVDLSVDPGERVALLGANGAGKTTTLLMILGVLSPDNGSVTIFGNTLPRRRSEAMALLGFSAGYLPLPDRMRVREVLGVFADIYGLDDGEAAIQKALEQFGIPHLQNQMASELSSGQRTLVGIVKATLHRPKLLVLDEPTASLDPDVAHRARTGLEAVCDEDGTALLVTSHNMSEVERICSRVIFLSHGSVVANGEPSAVAAQFGRDNLEEVFLHLAAEDI